MQNYCNSWWFLLCEPVWIDGREKQYIKARASSSLWKMGLAHHQPRGTGSQGMDPLSGAGYPSIQTWPTHKILLPHSWKPLRSQPAIAMHRGLVQAQKHWLSLLSHRSKEFQSPDMALILNCLKQQSAPSTERMAQQSVGTDSSPAFSQDWCGCACRQHASTSYSVQHMCESVQLLPRIMPHSKNNWCVPALFCTNLLKFQCKWPDS